MAATGKKLLYISSTNRRDIIEESHAKLSLQEMTRREPDDG